MEEEKPACTWRACRRSPNPCLAWCKCVCHQPKKTPDEDKLLADVMRKFLTTVEGAWAPYVDISGDRIVIDGDVEGLSLDQSELLTRLYREAKGE